jgi:hypothetical protein
VAREESSPDEDDQGPAEDYDDPVGRAKDTASRRTADLAKQRARAIARAALASGAAVAWEELLRRLLD